MKAYTKMAMARLIKEGRIEVIAEATRAGYTEIKWIRTGRREIVVVC